MHKITTKKYYIRCQSYLVFNKTLRVSSYVIAGKFSCKKKKKKMWGFSYWFYREKEKG